MAAGLGFKTFNTGDVLTAGDTNGYLMQGVWVFASAAARTAAVTSPQEGNVSFLKDTNSFEIYDGAAWVAYGSGDITGVTAGTGISGGGTSGDVTVTNSMATAIDAKGDLIVGTGDNTFSRLAVSATANHGLIVDSSTGTGLKWAATPTSTLTTTGDILYASAANTLARLGIGTDGQVLKVASGLPSWGAASAGATFAGCSLYNSANISVANVSNVVLTFNSEFYDTDGYHSTSSNTSRITVPSGKAGKYLINAKIVWASNATGVRVIHFQKNGTLDNNVVCLTAVNGDETRMGAAMVYDLAVGDYVELVTYQSSGGSLNVMGTSGASGVFFQASYLGA